jgi:iron complex transport system ATP-binding protein
MAATTALPVLRCSTVGVERGSVPVLTDVSWEVCAGERWVVLGPNGSGKTTLLQLASGYLHPTRGTVEVLGRRLGRTDVRDLRRQVSLVSGSLTRAVRPSLSALEVVVSGKDGALEPWWQPYDEADWERAAELLESACFAGVAGRPFGRLSEGERQQVLLARALMGSPSLVLLDEPCAGLDMGGRERLLDRLSSLAGLPTSPPLIMVTHHVEEIPAGFTHALLLREGRVLAAGPLGETLSARRLTDCFGLGLSLRHDAGRWASTSLGRPAAGPTGTYPVGSNDSKRSLMSETE